MEDSGAQTRRTLPQNPEVGTMREQFKIKLGKSLSPRSCSTRPLPGKYEGKKY